MRFEWLVRERGMHINKTLLQNYFAARCTAEEAKAVLEYLSDENSDLTELHLLLDEQQQVQPEELPAPLLRSLISGIRKNTYSGFLKPAKLINRKWWYAAAAAVLIPAVIFFSNQGAGGENPQQAAHSSQPDWATVTNRADYTQKAQLPDGTSIWLTPGSSFHYSPERFGQSNRVIRLEGEAFFRVAPDKQHPFIVQHGAISTYVLGTAFNIEAYKDEAEIRVSLLTGKVAIKSTGDTILNNPLQYLAPGQQMIYVNKDGAIEVKPLVYVQEEIWTKGWIVLDDVPLATALKRLQRQHGLYIVIPADIDISKKKVTAVFKGGSVKDILHNMLFAHHLRFEQKNKTILIRKAADNE